MLVFFYWNNAKTTVVIFPVIVGLCPTTTPLITRSPNFLKHTNHVCIKRHATGFPYLLSLCEGNPPVTPHKGLLMQIFTVFFAVNLENCLIISQVAGNLRCCDSSDVTVAVRDFKNNCLTRGQIQAGCFYDAQNDGLCSSVHCIRMYHM